MTFRFGSESAREDELSRAGHREFRTKLTTLDNGLTVITLRRPEALSTAFVFGVHYGHLKNVLDQSGKPIAHFEEHMLHAGTTTRTAKDIWRALSLLAIDHDAVTSSESITYFLRSNPKVAFESVELLSDMIKNPTFDELEIKRERGPINEEYAAKPGSPSFRLARLVLPALFDGHPISVTSYFTPQQVNSVTREDLVNAHNTYYSPSNSVFVAYGAFDEKEILESVQQRLGNMKGEYKREELPKANLEQKELTIEDTFPGLQKTTISIGLKRPPLTADSDLTETVATDRAVGFLSYKLFEEARLERGLVYGIGARGYVFGSYAYSEITTEVIPQRVDEVKDLIFSVLRRIFEGEIDGEQLRRKARAIIRNTESSYESVSDIALNLANNAIVFNRPFLFEAAEEIDPKITLDDVRAAAAKYLNPEKAVTVLLRPKRD